MEMREISPSSFGGMAITPLESMSRFHRNN
jgi:hypothetical protein